MWRTAQVAVAQATAVQVAGRTGAPVSTYGRTLSVKLRFVPTTDAAVVIAAESEAQLTTGGFPLKTTDPATAEVFMGDDDIDLVANDELWVEATEAGVLYVSFDGA